MALFSSSNLVIFWYVLPVLVGAWTVGFLLYTFLPLLTAEERLHFLWDLEEYEYRKFRDFTDCTFFSEWHFRVRVWVYHLFYGQRKYPKPSKENKE